MRAAGLLGYPGKSLFYIPAISLLFSCTGPRQDIPDEMPKLYSDPITVPVNTAEGYKINPLTGDSILPIINLLGDTVTTGVPVPAKVTIADPGSMGKPIVIPAGKPRVVPVRQNVHKIPENLTIIPVNKDALKTFTACENNSSIVLVNSFGDTIPSGVPIPVKGKVVNFKQPLPVKALIPDMEKNAILNMRYLDVEHGLKSSVISSITKDRHGNLWIGSWGGGVSKYDGVTFTHYTHEAGLCDNIVRCILEDGHGNLWFGTHGGVSKFNGETFTNFTEREGLCNNYILSILEDNNGSLWFGTQGGQVCKYDGKTLTHFTRKEGLINDYVTAILEDSRGNLWFGHGNITLGIGGGVSKYNGKTFTHFTLKEGLCHDCIRSILEDSQGNLWFGAAGGATMYNGNTFTHFTRKEGLSDDYVYCILEDSHSNLWFGTRGGVSMYDGNSFTHITQQEGLHGNNVTSIIEDNRGNLWFAGVGVTMYVHGIHAHLTQNEGLFADNIWAIAEDRHGDHWFGAFGTVTKYDGNSFTHFTYNEGLKNNTVRSILEDSQGNFWFGTVGGGTKYAGNTFTHFTLSADPSKNSISAVLEDSQGNVWFGGESGVSMYNGETFWSFSDMEDLGSNIINAILEDSQGNLWFGTEGRGVSRYDGKSIKHFTQREGLSNDHVTSILEDSKGNLWFGTHHGVSLYNGNTITFFTEKEGLSNNWIRSILEDRNGNIWIGTQTGLNQLVFGRDTLSNHPVIYTYGKQDGFRFFDFMTGSVLLDSENNIWWGGLDGVAKLDMNRFRNPAEPPQSMQLKRIEINGQFIDYRNLDESTGIDMKIKGVSWFNNYPLRLKLPKKNNHLTFYFSAIDWSAPHKIRYSFKMDGLDENWSQPSSDNKAEYRSLPHGYYTFTVRAMGAAQKWSEPFEYFFVISPPFWLSWWAVVIYAFVYLLLVRLYRRFVVKREKIKADLKIKEMEIVKMQELDLMKSRFFANISHEFRTPLTLIHGPIEDLRKQFKGSMKGSKEIFQTVLRNTRRLQDLINQLLDISKLETGNIKLQLTRDDLAVYIKTIILSFLSFAEHKKIRYEYDLPGEGRMVFFDHDKIEKIVTNLISNAFKYTRSGGRVLVNLHYNDLKPDDTAELVIIKVSDTGMGIPAGKLEKIFDRFYQVSDQEAGEVTGTGLGLALTRELVELYRGEIRVDSVEGKGSVFTVTLPVSESQFREEEFAEPPESDVTRLEPEAVAGVESHVPDPGISKPEVLIIEDNVDLMNYISRNLESEYVVLSAEDGKAGLERAREKIPDLVISDVMMPVMDGVEMCRLIKTDDRTDHIPVIMLTAKADMPSKLEGLETGADDYMVKPFNTEELKVRVRNLLDQRRRLREKFRKEYVHDTTDIESSPQDQFLKKLFEIFDQNISNAEYRLDQLSGELNLSRSQVQRKVLALTNYTPVELFRNHRLKKAAVYFRSGHTHVAQVMHRVGFNNQSYFTKCFGELFGKTPSQFITSCNKK